MKSATTYPLIVVRGRYYTSNSLNSISHNAIHPTALGLLIALHRGLSIKTITMCAWKYGLSFRAIVTNAKESFSIYGYLSSSPRSARLMKYTGFFSPSSSLIKVALTTAEETALEELIELTGHLPLAVALMATVASFEGYLGALSRWNTENISLLSEGHDKRFSLEKSINMSLTSPRIKSNPHALDLLGLLSLLPDGISEDDLVSSKVPLLKISKCRSSLLQTSLAFISDRRLKALAPIRDYIRRAYPASAAFTQPLLNHFQALLRVWNSHQDLSNVLVQISSHLGNITSLLSNASISEGFAQPEIGRGILTLISLSKTMLKDQSVLVQYLPGIIESSHDDHLKWAYICMCVATAGMCSPKDAEALATQGVQYFAQHNDYESQGML